MYFMTLDSSFFSRNVRDNKHEKLYKKVIVFAKYVVVSITKESEESS